MKPGYKLFTVPRSCRECRVNKPNPHETCEHLKNEEPLYSYSENGVNCVAEEWLLDAMFPDKRTLAAQKRLALEWVRLQEEPVSLRSIAQVPPGPDPRTGCGWRAVKALIDEGSIVKVDGAQIDSSNVIECHGRFYAPVKVTLGGKTVFVEPISIANWKQRRSARRDATKGQRARYLARLKQR